MKYVTWPVFSVALFFPALVLAWESAGLTDWGGELADRARVSGSLRAGYWGSSRSVDDRENLATSALWLKAEPRLSRNVSLNVEGWVRSQELFHENETWGDLREASLTIRLGRVDLRLGKQIIVWGRADRLNPTDVLTPRNFTLLVPEDDDQRIGVPALKATYYLGGLSLTGLWLPDFVPHVIPLRQPPPPVRLRERGPGTTVAQWAVKLEQTGKAVDWSLSYFDGFDLIPDVRIGRVSPSLVPVFLTHNGIRVIGADAATTLGRYGLRAEAAYTFTEDSGGRNPLIKNPFLYVVMGGDRTFYEYLNINFQYFLRAVQNFHNPFDITDPLRRAAALEDRLLTAAGETIRSTLSNMIRDPEP